MQIMHTQLVEDPSQVGFRCNMLQVSWTVLLLCGTLSCFLETPFFCSETFSSLFSPKYSRNVGVPKCIWAFGPSKRLVVKLKICRSVVLSKTDLGSSFKPYLTPMRSPGWNCQIWLFIWLLLSAISSHSRYLTPGVELPPCLVQSSRFSCSIH